MTDSVEEEEDLLEFVILNGNSVLSIGNRMNCTTVVLKFFRNGTKNPCKQEYFWRSSASYILTNVKCLVHISGNSI